MEPLFLNSYKKVLISLAIIYFLLAIIGGLTNYSPVPFWDAWGCYIDFFIKATNGDLAVWWQQHNEHRIPLSKVFFWLDSYFFHGKMILLLIINYFCMLANILIYFYILKSLFPGKENNNIRIIVISYISIMLLSLIQKENIYWTIQMVSFFAQLLPLVSFYLLFLSYNQNSNKLYLISTIIGFSCIGTQANGVLVLPMMVVMASLLKLGYKKISGLAVLSILSLYAYFYHYHSVKTHSSVSDALKNHVFELIQYIFTYFGGPLYYIGGDKHFIYLQIAGFFFIASTIFFICKIIYNKKINTIQLVLISYIIFIIGSSIGTAAGRYIFGLVQATASRYMTAVLMGWSALFILYVKNFYQQFLESPSIFIILLFIPFILLPEQLSALSNKRYYKWEKMVSALAIELNVHDEKQLKLIFPKIDRLFNLAKQSKERHLSIFGHPLIKNITNIIGQKELGTSDTLCLGHVDTIEIISGESRYARISGWLYDQTSKRAPASLFFVDHQNNIIGYAITGQLRFDIPNSIDSHDPGFKGYIISDHINDLFAIKGNKPDCKFFPVST